MLLGDSDRNLRIPFPSPPNPFSFPPSWKRLRVGCAFCFERHLALKKGKGPGCGPQGIEASAWFGLSLMGDRGDWGSVDLSKLIPLWNKKKQKQKQNLTRGRAGDTSLSQLKLKSSLPLGAGGVAGEEG